MESAFASVISRVIVRSIGQSGMSPYKSASASENLKNFLRGHGNHRAGPVNSDGAGAVEKFVILRRNDAADPDENVIASECAQLVDQLRDERFMARRQ